MDFVVLHKTGISIECLYYGIEVSNIITGMSQIDSGSLISIGEDVKFIVNKGWFILVRFNNREEFVCLNTLEELIEAKKIMLILDVELEKLVLQYQIDYALKEKNKSSFYKCVKKLKGLQYDEIQGASIN
ncbi:hypothetical protein [Alkalihalobacillus sp. BA299]|uniref:hypothetical protein n=1 Tax=Alkalihalobacillus sp. BA299 TaxID=2815938 RepID=UPI001ADAD649|nr:hypothetical protein [Alkalihalobacillus sp. BA299]